MWHRVLHIHRTHLSLRRSFRQKQPLRESRARPKLTDLQNNKQPCTNFKKPEIKLENLGLFIVALNYDIIAVMGRAIIRDVTSKRGGGGGGGYDKKTQKLWRLSDFWIKTLVWFPLLILKNTKFDWLEVFISCHSQKYSCSLHWLHSNFSITWKNFHIGRNWNCLGFTFGLLSIN